MHIAIGGLNRVLNKGKLLWLALLFFCHGNAQSTAYTFRHLTVNDGLSNGVVKSIAQDKYGYLWLATGSGVCLYNGYSVKAFLHSDKEPFSPPDNLPLCIVCDQDKRIWISFENGLYRFDYNTSSFRLQPHTTGFAITKMAVGKEGILYCITRSRLMLFHTSDSSFAPPSLQKNDLIKQHISDISLSKKGIVYLASDAGLIVYQPSLQKASVEQLKPVADQPVAKVMADAGGNVWMSYGKDNNQVIKTDSSFTHYQVYNDFLYGSSNTTGSQITDLFTDNKNRVWIATSRAGLCLYDSSRNGFVSFSHDPLQPMSLSSYLVTTIFQDNEGFIWTGTEGYGLNFFNPDDNLFHSILPDNDPSFVRSDHWYRAAVEDKAGNLWMGSMNGITRYDSTADTYSVWQNKKGSADRLYSNSVRSLLYDSYGYVWIGTAEGLNRYNPATEHMDFFDEKDSIPRSFFWSLLQDDDNNVWIGCRDGIYCYHYATHTFEHFTGDSLLSPYHTYNIISLFQDIKKRVWLGCYNKGVIMIDQKNHSVTHWMKNSDNPAFISNNIKSFTEDRRGTVWIATYDGLLGYTSDGKFITYRQEQGLKTPNVCALLTDSHDRIWIGSGNGLFMLDSARKQIVSFTEKDGLPSSVFNEQSALQTRSGMFVYPTLQGFITFNPDDYKENDAGRNVFISSVNVFNKKYTTAVNPEELNSLHLASDENFFSLELSSPNYSSPQRTWFAYRLEPFDKDWIYTKDRLVNYTNVPGGSYTFHYKASANKKDWNVPEKTIAIHIDTVFYRTAPFWILLGCLFLLLVYVVYKYRIQQQEKIFQLQNKTQLLEKEKAVVQYENLKQQLNPHFLFNSLTSLRSLIRIDKQSAADFLDKISLNYRYILKNSESELVPLKDELAFVQTYIDLQQTRFGKGLQVSIHVPDEQLGKKIVPVTLQNLIDNAIKHNSLDVDEPLLITIFSEDNYLVVSNNLRLREYVETSNQHGLDYLISLYKHLDKRPLLIDKTTTHFNVKIPLL